MKIVFFDRDGVINISPIKGEYITSWSEFKFKKDIMKTLKLLSGKKYILFIVTNQQCIGKGLLKQVELDYIHNKLNIIFTENNIDIKQIYTCPHLEIKNCPCRKPKTGMLNNAAKDYNLSLLNKENKFYMVGDNETDIIAGNMFGCTTILLDNNKKCKTSANHIINNVYDVVDIIN